MKLYSCSVKLNDSTQHVVPNKIVTVPEIAVLQVIHGAAAVTDIRPLKDENGQAKEIKRADAEERQRLSQRYDNATPGENDAVVARLFPALQPLPQTLRAIGIDPQAAAAEMRRKAEELAASALLLDEGDEDAPDAQEDVDAFFDEEEPTPSKSKKAA